MFIRNPGFLDGNTAIKWITSWSTHGTAYCSDILDVWTRRRVYMGSNTWFRHSWGQDEREQDGLPTSPGIRESINKLKKTITPWQWWYTSWIVKRDYGIWKPYFLESMLNFKLSKTLQGKVHGYNYIYSIERRSTNLWLIVEEIGPQCGF